MCVQNAGTSWLGSGFPKWSPAPVRTPAPSGSANTTAMERDCRAAWVRGPSTPSRSGNRYGRSVREWWSAGAEAFFIPGSTHTSTQGEVGSRPAAPCPNLRERQARRRSSPRREPPWRAQATRGLRGRYCTHASRPLPPDPDELLGRSITTYGVVTSTCGTASRPNTPNGRVSGCSRPSWCACRTLL